MKRLSIAVLALIFVQPVFAQFKNIKLAELSGEVFPPAGPSIAINHKNPDNIVAGVEKDRAFYSKDGGASWFETKLQSPFGMGGYPTLISDSKGGMYFFHLSDLNGKGQTDDAWLDRIICQKSSDEGATWKSGEPFGYQPGKNQYRAWASVAFKKQDLYATWTQFDKYGATDTTLHSNIMFSLSDSDGKKWSKPVRLNQFSGDCALSDNTTTGAMTAVDVKGRIFATWAHAGSIYFDRSYDNGKTWLSHDLPITQQQGGWAMEIPGIKHGNGTPSFVIDNSPSRYHGSLYIVWADQRNGADDTDVWMIRSGNGGDNWSPPLRINKDERQGTHQFLPWVTVDQTTGYVYVVYYDRRNYDDTQTDVYLAYSADGGSSFGEAKISESPFTPDGNFSLEHINISAHKGVVAPIWTRSDNGKISVITSIIKDGDFQKK